MRASNEGQNLGPPEPQGKLWVDTAFWGGLVPGNAANRSALDVRPRLPSFLAPPLAALNTWESSRHVPSAFPQALLGAGVVGLKAFLSPSGIDDFEQTAPSDLTKALPALKAAGGKALMVHAELPPKRAPGFLGAPSCELARTIGLGGGPASRRPVLCST